MKKYYSLVVSVLNKDGNRVDAHEITGGNNKKDILKERTQLREKIKNSIYDHLNKNDCTLYADVEVHNDDTWELLEII